MKFAKYTFLLLLIATCAMAALADPMIPETPSAQMAMIQRNWKGIRVLHIGDSHLENWGLKGTLRQKFQAAGAVYNVSAWKGSSSRSWLRSGKLMHLLQQKSPHVVIVNLGTNVSRAQRPADYAGYITRLVEKIGARECFWVSPPPLIADEHGFYDMLESASKPCKYLDSRKIPFDVSSKRVFHLNRRQSTLWAEEIWKWLNSSPAESGTDHGV